MPDARRSLSGVPGNSRIACRSSCSGRPVILTSSTFRSSSHFARDRGRCSWLEISAFANDRRASDACCGSNRPIRSSPGRVVGLLRMRWRQAAAHSLSCRKDRSRIVTLSPDFIWYTVDHALIRSARLSGWAANGKRSASGRRSGSPPRSRRSARLGGRRTAEASTASTVARVHCQGEASVAGMRPVWRAQRKAAMRTRRRPAAWCSSYSVRRAIRIVLLCFVKGEM